jgi:hypothetical protein
MSEMPVVVLPLAYILIFIALKPYESGVRARAIFAACIWGALLFGITEVLSAIHLIARSALAYAWMGVCFGAAACLLIQARDYAPGRAFRAWTKTWRDFPQESKVLSVGVVVLATLVALTAIVAPPNTWDAIYYHMPRVMMWISNRSIAFYPTLDFDQLLSAPWAEYAMLHLMLLAGNDHLVNLVELSSWVGATIGASLIAQELGAGRRGQVLAAVTCATIPQGVLEASGAMNCVVVAFWIVSCVFGLLRFSRIGGWLALLSAAAASGLAIATKGTAYPILPVIGVACWWLARPVSKRSFLVRLPSFVLIVLLLNGPLWLRNFALTGSPLGNGFAEGGPRFQRAVGRLSIRGSAANVVRNLALQVTVSDRIDRVGGQIASKVIRLMGEDPDDPDFLWHPSAEAPTFDHFRTNGPGRDEVLAGNPLHLLLIVLACWLALSSREEGSREVRMYTLGLIGSFLMFSVLLRWQPWGGRYQLAFFALGAGLVGVIVPSRIGRATATAVGAVLIVAVLPYALSNDLRPLLSAQLAPSRFFRDPFAGSIWTIPRYNIYFADLHKNLARSYEEVGNAVLGSACKDVGIDDSLELYDYPLMAFLEVGSGRRRVRYMGVFNSSLKYRDTGSSPCAVICFACARVPHKWAEYRSFGNRVSIFADTAVFSSSGRIANNEALQGASVRDRVDSQGIAQAALSHFFTLRDLNSRRMGEMWRLYQWAGSEHPGVRSALEERIDAIERPVQDAARAWELTAALRVQATNGAPGVDFGPLVDAEQALGNFAADSAHAMSEFVGFVNGLSQPVGSDGETSYRGSSLSPEPDRTYLKSADLMASQTEGQAISTSRMRKN